MKPDDWQQAMENEAATAPDATATAEPPDEPPGVRPGRSGLSGAGRPVGSV